VIAVGLLVPFAGLDNLDRRFARERFGVSTGLIFTGTIGLLVLAYMARSWRSRSTASTRGSRR
jgi:iron(III) transport system permease protein